MQSFLRFHPHFSLGDMIFKWINQEQSFYFLFFFNKYFCCDIIDVLLRSNIPKTPRLHSFIHGVLVYLLISK